MKNTSSKFKTLAILGALMLTTSHSAEIMPIPLPDSLKGEWEILIGEKSCGITLSSEKFAQASGHKLTAHDIQGECQLLANAVAWRPAPDGIALLDKEGSTILFFSRDQEIYRSEIYGNSGHILQRKK